MTVPVNRKVPVRGLTGSEDVHDFYRRFVRSLVKETLEFAWGITATKNGSLMVVDLHASCVYMFSVSRDHLN